MERYTKKEATARIEQIAKTCPGGTITDDKLGYRCEGVPGTGGGTLAVSFVAGNRRRADGKNYVEVDFC